METCGRLQATIRCEAVIHQQTKSRVKCRRCVSEGSGSREIGPFRRQAVMRSIRPIP